MISKQKQCPPHFHIKKSLKNRIRSIVNLSIFMTIIFLGFIYVGLANKGIIAVEKTLSSYYVEEIQQILNRIEEQISTELLTMTTDIAVDVTDSGGDGVTDGGTDDAAGGTVDVSNVLTAKRVMSNRMFIEKMATLKRVVPILSVDIYVHEELTYQVNAEDLFQSYFEQMSETVEVELTLEEEQDYQDFQDLQDFKDMKVNRNISQLYSQSGEVIGSVEVGIDVRVLVLIYAIVIVPILFGSFLVMLVMRVITHLITKPILNPLKKLNSQLELLADENYENINPSIEIGKRSVKEVVEISQSTNKLLTKMIKYNEVITQSEKMASIGQLTAAITHEINTPLGVINSNAGLMQLITTEVLNATTEDERQLLIGSMAETASTTEEACLRIQEIIRSLRSYSRIDQADFMPANINDSIKSVITLTTNLHKNKIKIVEHLGQIPDVSCYIGLINQVFMNIMINAIQSIEKEGTITFVTTSDNENVYAKIMDTGCGIEKKNFYRVFEYGFTTKQPGSGSGIGLALSKNIMMKHNGEILIDSEVGVGTTITIKLPIKQTIEVK